MVAALFTVIHDEVQRIWCYRWLAAATALVLFGAAAAYVMRMPYVYDAWGQVYIDKRSPLTAAAEGVSLLGENYAGSYVVQRTLLNDESLEEVVRQIEPASALKTQAQVDAAVANLRSRLSGKPDGGDGFIELHYKDTDPVRAQKVVSVMLNLFIAKNLDRAQTDLGRASQFLDEQIEAYSEMLLASQDKMAAFRRRHPEVAAVTQPAVEEFIEGAPPPPAATGAPQAPAGPSAAAERVSQLEARLSALRMSYTEQYPDVVATRRQLADAMAQRDLEAGLAAAAAALQPAAPTPAGKPAQSYGSRRRIIGPVPPPPPPPGVAAAWADLQRRDEVLRANYQQLIAKRAGAQMSKALYGGDGSDKYQITREPTVPTVAVGPNRKLYLAGAALMALCGGLAAGYLRAAMKGILVSTHELENAFQLPVIATVSWEPAWHTGRRGASPRRLGGGARKLQPST